MECKWIPVSERLPDTDGELIFTIKQESGSKTVTGEYVKHSDGCRSWTWWDDLGQCTVFNETEYEDEDGKPSVLQEDGDEYYTFITAWMPMSLPEPYTEDKV